MQSVFGSSLIQLKQKDIKDEGQATLELDEMRPHDRNFEHWETMKVTLLSLSKTSHMLIAGCHHIAMDGLSFQIFFADLERAYMGQKLTPAPAESQYRAFHFNNTESMRVVIWEQTLNIILESSRMIRKRSRYFHSLIRVPEEF